MIRLLSFIRKSRLIEPARSRTTDTSLRGREREREREGNCHCARLDHLSSFRQSLYNTKYKAAGMGEKRVLPPPLKKVLDLDVALTDKFVKYVDRNYGPLTKYKSTMKGLEYSCHGIPWFIGTATFIFLLQDSSIRQLLVNLFIAMILDVVVVAVVKAITRRRRPTANKSDEMFATMTVDKFSFPSGHSTRAVLLSFLLPMQYELFLPLSIALMVWGGSVCVSRVLLHRHHILDVLGGIAIGFLEAVIVSYFWLSESSAAGVVNFFLDETQTGASYDV